MKVTAWAAMGLSLAAVTGCARAPEVRPAGPADRVEGELAFHVERGPILSARVTADEIRGMNGGAALRPFRLTRAPDGSLEGVVSRAPIALTPREHDIGGVIGGAPTRIEVAREDDQLHATGLVHGRHADFHLGTQGLRGTIGLCSYDLAWTGGDFEGKRACGAVVESASLSLPPALAAWGDADLVAALAVLLDDPGDACEPSPSSPRNLTAAARRVLPAASPARPAHRMQIASAPASSRMR